MTHLICPFYWYLLKSMKKILTVLCISSVLLGYAFADGELLGDCSLFQGQSSFSVPFVDSFIIDAIYPSENRKIAVENLRAYCCWESNLKEWLQCANIKSKNFAYSNQLYDHLVDVGFRALDWDPDLQYEWQVLDTVWTDRFKKLYNEENWYAINPLWEVPLKIRKDFGTYWGLQENWSVQYDLNEFKNPKDNTDQYSKYIEKREKIPTDETTDESIGLASRYLIICHIAQSLHPQQPRYTAGFDSCKKIALERIHGEIAYVQYLLSHQWITALMANFNAYTQWYLVQSEMNRLLEKITEMNAGLTHINSKVSEMTKMCSD